LNNKPHILLGKKQVYNNEIQNMCKKITTCQSDLANVAFKFLDEYFSEESEFILRKVMLEYPNKNNR
jgi:hypothetical protein